MKYSERLVPRLAAAFLIIGTVSCGDEGHSIATSEKGFVNGQQLVDAEWVQRVLDGENPANNEESDYVILECSWGPAHAEDGYGPTDYETGHIPGSIHFNTDNFENGYPMWYLLPDSEIQSVIESFGITKDTTVVVYSSWQIAAARIMWILLYAGVEDVRFLDGGFEAWIDADGAVETADSLPTPVDDFGAVVPVYPEYLATTEQVFAVNEADDPEQTVLMDVRSWAEFIGDTSGYKYIDAMGRIPAAVWANHADDSSQDYLTADGALLTAEDVEAIWQPLGATSDKELIFYCGGGWRSSLSFLYGYLMGYSNIRNYSSGWSEWSTDFGPPPDFVQTPSGNPLVVGAP